MFKRICEQTGIILVVLVLLVSGVQAELLIGTASTSITPDEPVALGGQWYLRIASEVDSPVTANVIALESSREGNHHDMAVMVSCDLVWTDAGVLEAVREAVRQRLPDLDPAKIFLNGTHTHAGPVTYSDTYNLPEKGVMPVEAYREFLVKRIADSVVDAWKSRQPGRVSWGLAHAVVARNRRPVYADGSAIMYGKTSKPNFRGLEGPEDHDIGSLFFWNQAGEMIGIAINVACPSQEVENNRAISADFWHPVREALKAQYGKQLCVLGWTGAAGDQSPHLMVYRAAEDRMRELRGLTRLEEIARRIVRAVNEAHDAVEKDQHADPLLIHRVEKLQLPMRIVTKEEYDRSKGHYDRMMALFEKDPKAMDRWFRKMKWYEVTLQRFQQQKTDPKPTYEMELHTLRIGDVAICTNPFELYTDFGIQIKARSKSLQTFVIQLAGSGTYLPTQKAVRGGGYSAEIDSNLVGPEAGQVLVDRTIALLDSIWEDSDE